MSVGLFFQESERAGLVPVRNPSNHQTLENHVFPGHFLWGKNCLKKELAMRNLCLVCFLVQFPYVCYWNYGVTKELPPIFWVC